MELQSDRGSLTWRDVKKAAIAAIGSSIIATLGQSLNFDLSNKAVPFFHMDKQMLLTTAGVAFSTLSAELARRFFTDRVKSAKITIEKAEKKQIKKQQLI